MEMEGFRLLQLNWKSNKIKIKYNFAAEDLMPKQITVEYDTHSNRFPEGLLNKLFIQKEKFGPHLSLLSGAITKKRMREYLHLENQALSPIEREYLGNTNRSLFVDVDSSKYSYADVEGIVLDELHDQITIKANMQAENHHFESKYQIGLREDRVKNCIQYPLFSILKQLVLDLEEICIEMVSSVIVDQKRQLGFWDQQIDAEAC